METSSNDNAVDNPKPKNCDGSEKPKTDYPSGIRLLPDEQDDNRENSPIGKSHAGPLFRDYNSRDGCRNNERKHTRGKMYEIGIRRVRRRNSHGVEVCLVIRLSFPRKRMDIRRRFGRKTPHLGARQIIRLPLLRTAVDVWRSLLGRCPLAHPLEMIGELGGIAQVYRPEIVSMWRRGARLPALR